MQHSGNAGIPSISFSLLMLWCERVSLTCHFNLSLAPPRHWLLMHAVRKMSSQILRISGGSRYTCLSFHSSPFFVIVWSSGFFRVKNNHVIAHCCVSAPKKVQFFFILPAVVVVWPSSTHPRNLSFFEDAAVQPS